MTFALTRLKAVDRAWGLLAGSLVGVRGLNGGAALRESAILRIFRAGGHGSMT